ncbi:MAG: hypothetical protein AB2809_10620 [Candidatus Thiodiazotropha sp.]
MMKAKALILASALSVSVVTAAPAQAHDYYDYPYGLLGGLFLGLSWNHYHDRGHSHRHGDRHYRHREYRRSESHGHRHRDKHRRHRHGDKHRHRRDRWD